MTPVEADWFYIAAVLEASSQTTVEAFVDMQQNSLSSAKEKMEGLVSVLRNSYNGNVQHDSLATFLELNLDCWKQSPLLMDAFEQRLIISETSMNSIAHFNM